MKNYIELKNLKRLPSSRFRYDNSIRYTRLMSPVYWDTANGRTKVEDGYFLSGWCKKLPPELLYGENDVIGIMLWHKEWEDIWLHFPILEETPEEMKFFGESLS